MARRPPRVAPAAGCTNLHTAATLQSVSCKAVHTYLHLIGHIQFRLLCVGQIANSVNLDTRHVVIFVGYVIEPENGQTAAGGIDGAWYGDRVCALPSKVLLEDLSLCSRRRQSEHSTTALHHCTAPLHCTTAPLHCTTAQHHGMPLDATAPLHSTTACH